MRRLNKIGYSLLVLLIPLFFIAAHPGVASGYDLLSPPNITFDGFIEQGPASSSVENQPKIYEQLSIDESAQVNKALEDLVNKVEKFRTLETKYPGKGFGDYASKLQDNLNGIKTKKLMKYYPENDPLASLTGANQALAKVGFLSTDTIYFTPSYFSNQNDIDRESVILHEYEHTKQNMMSKVWYLDNKYFYGKESGEALSSLTEYEFLSYCGVTSGNEYSVVVDNLNKRNITAEEMSNKYSEVTKITGGGLDNAINRPASSYLSIDPSNIKLAPGQQYKFTTSVYGMPDAKILWRAGTSTRHSENSPIPPDGTYTAPAKVGVYYVTATCMEDEGLTAAATVTVEPAIIIFPESSTLLALQQQNLFATVSGLDDSMYCDLTWQATGGHVEVAGDGLSATYTAPIASGNYQVTVEGHYGYKQGKDEAIFGKWGGFINTSVTITVIGAQPTAGSYTGTISMELPGCSESYQVPITLVVDETGTVSVNYSYSGLVFTLNGYRNVLSGSIKTSGTLSDNSFNIPATLYYQRTVYTPEGQLYQSDSPSQSVSINGTVTGNRIEGAITSEGAAASAFTAYKQ